jgi:hypothetical protein
LLLQIGGYVDTAFKEMSQYPKFSGNEKCKYIRKKVSKDELVTISDFREAFEPIYDLSKRSVAVLSTKHFALLIDVLAPFSEFGEEITPKWWTAYNKVKHNWLKNFKKANLENTLRALSGAFLLNVIHEPSLLALAKGKIAKTFLSNWKEIRFSDKLLDRLIKREQPLGDSIIIVDSQIFRWRLKWNLFSKSRCRNAFLVFGLVLAIASFISCCLR